MKTENVTVSFKNDDNGKEIKVSVIMDHDDDSISLNTDFGEGGTESHGTELQSPLFQAFFKAITNIGE